MEQITDLEIEVLGDIGLTGVPGESVLKPHSADIALDGNIYFSDEFNHRIIVTNSSGRFIRSIGRRGAGEGEFWYPRGLAAVNRASGAELFVCDAWNHRIQRFTLAGEYIGAFGGIGSGSGEFDEPSEIIALDGAVYILDRCNCRIVKTTPEGAFIEARGFRARIEDELWENDPVSIPFRQDSDPPPYHGYYFPSSFAHAPGYGFIVADTGNRRIKVVTESGALARAIGINPPGGERFHPASVVYLGEGLALAGDIGGTLHCLVDIAGRTDPVFGKAGWMEVCDRLMAASHDGSALTFSSSQAKLRWIKPVKAAVESLPVHPLTLTGLDAQADIGSGIGGVDSGLRVLNTFIGQCIAAEKDLSAAENTYINDILNFHLLQQEHLTARAQGEASRFKELELAAMLLAFKGKPQFEAILKLRNRYAESIRDATTLCKALQTDASANSGVKEASERLTGRMMSEYESSMDSLGATSAWLDQNLSNVQSLNAAHSMKAIITILALDFQLRLLEKAIVAGGMGERRFRNSLSPAMQGLKAKLRTPFELSLNGYMCLVAICVEREYYPTAKALIKAMELLQPQKHGFFKIVLANLELQAGDGEEALATIATIDDYPQGRATLIDIMSAAYAKLGRFDDAIQAVESAIAGGSYQQESLPAAYAKLGGLRESQGNLPLALASYKLALEKAQGRGDDIMTTESMINIGKVSSKLGIHDEGASWYEKAVELSDIAGKNPLDTAFRIAELYERMCAYGQGAQWYARIVNDSRSLSNTDARDKAIARYAMCVAFGGDVDGANEWLARHPTSQMTQEKAFVCSFLDQCSDNHKEAVARMERILKIFPQTPIMHMAAGMVYAMAGDYEKSADALAWENANFPGVVAAGGDITLRRLKGEWREVLDLVTEEGERFFRDYLERLIASFLLNNKLEIEQSTKLMLSKWRNLRNSFSVVNVPQGQSEAVDKAIALVREAMEKDGGKLEVKKINPATMWFNINPDTSINEGG